MGGKSCALLTGKKIRHLIPTLCHYGVTTVYTHEDADFRSTARGNDIPSGDAIVQHSPRLVLFPGTHLGNDLACE